MKKLFCILLLTSSLFADTTEYDKKKTRQVRVGQRIMQIQMSDYTAIDLLAELNFPRYISIQDGKFRELIIDDAEMFEEKFSIQIRFYGNMILIFKIRFKDDEGVWTFKRITKKEI